MGKYDEIDSYISKTYDVTAEGPGNMAMKCLVA
jgi:hypothetical protein